jgi:tetratricopeptide (TPR) repeat protein
MHRAGDQCRVKGQGKGWIVPALVLLCVSVCGCGRGAHESPAPADASDLAAPAPSAADDLGDPPPPSAELPADVTAILDRLEREFPTSAEALFARGQILALHGQSHSALWCWRKCLALNPEFAHAHLEIGHTAVKQGNFDSAVKSYERAAELDPALPEVQLHLGKALLRLGKYQEAVPVLERQIEKDANSSEAWYRLGQARQELEDYEQAKKHYQRALDIFADCAPAWNGMAQVCEQLGEKERAQESRARFLQLDKALTKWDRERRQVDGFTGSNPQHEMSQTYAMAASVYAYRGLSDDAIEYWQRAAELDARNIVVRQSLAKALASADRAPEAMKVIEELRRLQPRNPDHLLAQAGLHQQMNRPEAAEAALRQAIDIAPDDPRAAAILARQYLASRRQLADAQRLAERVIQLQPTAENFFVLSSVCRANQDLSGARQALEEALRLDPRNPHYAAAARGLGEE